MRGDFQNGQYERKEIFNIHFNKFNKQVNDSLLSFSANHSEMFTGAEIKEAVKNIVRKANATVIEIENFRGKKQKIYNDMVI